MYLRARHFKGDRPLALGRDAIDGHLLRVLHHLLIEGSVSRSCPAAQSVTAGSQLGAAQAARNHRRPVAGAGQGGMTPTERGAALLEPVKLASPSSTRSSRRRHSSRRTSVGGNSTSALLTTSTPARSAMCWRECRRSAPSAQINLPLNGASASCAGALESGEMDVVIGNWPNPPDTLRTTALFQDRMVLLMRRTHPLADEELDARRYLEASHLVPTPYSVGQRGVVDMYLARERYGAT